MKWFTFGLRNYADFQGRASRSQFWWYILFAIIFYWVAILLDRILGTPTFSIRNCEYAGVISGLYWLALLIPSLTVSVRRLHDTGRSAWNLLWYLLPVIGSIILIIFYVFDSEPGVNKYGPNPKGIGI